MSVRQRILVVDDEQANRELLEALLTPEGYSVIEAESGVRALQLVSQGAADLVLLDVLMPHMDGIETLKKIRDELGELSLPVVLVTAIDDPSAQLRGKQAGSDDFLRKPVDEVELLARVRNLLRVKAYHDLREEQRLALEAELHRVREHLVGIERLATLGTLGGSIGHELNNIVTVQRGAVAMIRRLAEQGHPPPIAYLEELERVADHIGTHGSQLLALGRPAPERVELVDLRVVVMRCLSMLEGAGKTKDVQVRPSMPDEAVCVVASPTRIEQVMINLVGNAADALEEVRRRARRIEVRLEARAREGGSYAHCAVSDTGCGIPSEELDNIFDPYFTTKGPDRGTGLGLPVVRHIVESYGGRVSVESREAEGTTVAFELPLAPELDPSLVS